MSPLPAEMTVVGEDPSTGASSVQVTGFLAMIKRPSSLVYDGFLWQAQKLFFLIESQPHKSKNHLHTNKK